MAFDRPAPDEPWTLNGSAVLDQPLPAIARDSDGYAINVSTKDTSLLLPPDVVGATQAAVVDEGPAAPAAAVIANGSQTTGLYTTQAALGNSYTAQGLSYQWLLEGAAVPQFDLRTADGGALVIYTMYLNTTIEHPGNVFGPPIPIPADFTPIVTSAADHRRARGGRELDVRVRHGRPAGHRSQRQGRGHRGQRRPHLRRLLLGLRPLGLRL